MNAMLKSEIQKLSPGAALIHIIPNQGFDGPKMVPCTFVEMSGGTHARVSIQRPVTGDLEKLLANRTLYLPEEGQRVYGELRAAYDAKLRVRHEREDAKEAFAKHTNAVVDRYLYSGVTVSVQESSRGYQNRDTKSRIYTVLISESEIGKVVAFLSEIRKAEMLATSQSAKGSR